MRLSQYAGTAIVPTLSRLVLAAAFVTVGWNLCFNDAVFSGEEATRLHHLGISPTPRAPVTAWLGADGVRIQPAAFVQDAPPPPGTGGETPATQEPPPPTVPIDPPPATTQAPSSSTPPASSGAPAAVDANARTVVMQYPPGEYLAAARHRITLRLSEAQWPSPQWLALIAAVTQLVGGGMALLGFLTRIWALGLSVVLGASFYLFSMKTYFDVGPFVVAQGGDLFVLYNSVYCQAGLFVLAFGLLLTGAGPLSLDRWLFARSDGALPEEGGVIDGESTVNQRPM